MATDSNIETYKIDTEIGEKLNLVSCVRLNRSAEMDIRKLRSNFLLVMMANSAASHNTHSSAYHTGVKRCMIDE